MSRYCDNLIDAQLAAAEQWKKRCMIDQLSLFDDQVVWTPEAFQGLKEHFVDKPNAGAGNFLEKLAGQLDAAPPATQRLAVDLAWLLYLFPRGSMGPGKKRENLSAIAKIASLVLPTDHWALSPETLAGIGSTGTFFNTGFWIEYAFAALALQQMAALPKEQRAALMGPTSNLAGWLNGITFPAKLPGGPPLNPGGRQFRHIFLYLMQPDRYERISSTANKREILKAIAPKLSLTAALGSPSMIDEQLLNIRQQLEAQFGTQEIDFYRPPVHAMWTESAAPVAGVAEPSAPYPVPPPQAGRNHWLVGAYWVDRDERDMTQTFVAEGRWENGYRDRLLDTVKAVKAGDPIAIKTAYVQKHDLPFDNEGKSVSCMQIKARGVVIENPGDGRNLQVQWEEDFKPFVVYHYTYRTTIAPINEEKYPEVVQWIFGGVSQPLSMPSVDIEVDASDQQDDALLLDAYGPAPRNVIFYGPPGTGKTRALLEDVLPSYTDEPEQESDAERMARVVSELGWFEVIGSAVLELAQPTATVPEIRNHRYVQAKLQQTAAKNNLNQRIWGVLQNHTVLTSTTVNTAKTARIEPLVFDKSDTSGWRLVAEWKTVAPELVEGSKALAGGTSEPSRPQKRYEMVTFHPSYAYEDFVEGLRPVRAEREGEVSTIEILPVDGALKRICTRARSDPDHRYALVIDEINRGNIAKILGELITLIEPDKRVRYDVAGHCVHGVEVKLPYTGEAFGVPENVDFYGTMNTADRSIALVDIALRRRFIFREVLPQAAVIPGAREDGLIDSDDDGDAIDLRKLLRVLNARLTVLRGRDACIGHAYFTGVRDIAGLRAVFRDRVIPLLQEHFFEDWGQIALVLAVQKAAPSFLISQTPKLAALFGASTGDLADLADRPLWHLNPDLPAAAFRGLYEQVPDDALGIV